MQTRAGTGPNRQTSMLHHLVKCTLSGVLGDHGAFLRDEHGTLGSDAEPASDRDAEIPSQRVTRTRIKSDHALTPELRVGDQDDSLVQIDIADREPHSFPMRIPVTASSPIRVVIVAARNGVNSW